MVTVNGSEAEQIAQKVLDDGREDLTEEEFKNFLDAVQRLAETRGDWAGYPVPLSGFKLIVEPRFPYPGVMDLDEDEPKEEIIDAVLGALSDYETVNSWDCVAWHKQIHVIRNKRTGKSSYLSGSLSTPGERLTFNLQTLGASHAWDLNAELVAMQTLSTLISPSAFKYYVLTGGFLESSKRSRVMYWFRRNRPTVAMTGENRNGKDETVRILAALCLHPIGYYHDTFAGVMVPTDDVIAHLTMMRGDEHKFWSKANHHPLWEVRNGL